MCSPRTAAELSHAPPAEPSSAIAQRVARARHIQVQRYGADGPRSNAEADGKLIQLLPDADKLLEQAMERLRLSPRGHIRTMRVGRTIADLAGAETVRGASTSRRHWRSGIEGRAGQFHTVGHGSEVGTNRVSERSGRISTSLKTGQQSGRTIGVENGSTVACLRVIPDLPIDTTPIMLAFKCE